MLRRLLGSATAVLLVTGIAACGSDDGSSTTGASTAAATQTSTAKTPTGTPIVIGDTCDCSGTVASSGAGWAPALAVWAKWINSRGGILGHPVRIIEKDTKSTPTAVLAATKSLLANPKVVAVIPGSAQGVILDSAIKAAKLPVVGGLGVDPLSFTNPYVFPVSTTANNLTTVLAKVGAQGQTVNKAANLYCAEVAACKQSSPLFAAGVQKTGGKVVYTAAISAAAPDYTAQCLAAKGKGATYIWVANATAIISRVAEACAKNNYKPLFIIPNFDQAFLKVPSLDGAKYAFGNAPFNSAAAAEFRAAVEQFDPTLPEQPGWGQFSYQAWLSGQEVARAITLAKPTGDTVTRDDVFRGLYAFKDETLGGGAPRLNFQEGKPANIACGFAGQQKDGELSSVGGIIC